MKFISVAVLVFVLSILAPVRAKAFDVREAQDQLYRQLQEDLARQRARARIREDAEDAEDARQRSRAAASADEFRQPSKGPLDISKFSAPAQTPAAANQNDAPPILRGEVPAGVSGKVSCAGTSVGLAMGINGEINASTVESVRKLSDQYHELAQKVASGSGCDKSALGFGPKGFRVEVNSAGGNISAAMSIGKILRTERALLRVNGVCFSACVLILAGAVDRRVGASDQVGIHRPYFGTTPEALVKTNQIKDAYERMLQEMRGYLREMNVSQRLADDMLGVEPENNRVLTQTELQSYYLAGVDPAEQQTRACRHLEDSQIS